MQKRLIRILAPTIAGGVFLFVAAFTMPIKIDQDEARAIFLLKNSLGEIWNFAATSGFDPIYATVLKIWSNLVGNSLVALRFGSVLAGMIGLVLIFHLLIIWLKEKSAAIIVGILSLSPLVFHFTQEVRPAMLQILAGIMVLFVNGIILERKLSKRWGKIGLAIAGVLLVASGVGAELTSRRVDTQQIMSSLQAVIKEGELILTDQPDVYYATEVYKMAQRRILVKKNLTPKERLAEERYYQIRKSWQEATVGQKKVWYLTDRVLKAGEQLKSPVPGYEVKNQIATADYLALELVKSERKP